MKTLIGRFLILVYFSVKTIQQVAFRYGVLTVAKPAIYTLFNTSSVQRLKGLFRGKAGQGGSAGKGVESVRVLNRVVP